jgi:hypothetical protein
MESSGMLREGDKRIWVKAPYGVSKIIGGTEDMSVVDRDSPDSAIPAFLTIAGFTIEERTAFVSAECACTFLVSQLCYVGDIDALTFRVLGCRHPDKITRSSEWTDARTPTGKRTFSPKFWTNLLSDVECYASKEFVAKNPALAAIAGEMRRCGFVEYPSAPALRSAMFAFAFAANLRGKNALDLAADNGFMSLVGGTSWARMQQSERRVGGSNFVAALGRIDATNADMWVALLATSTFRMTPFVHETFAQEAIPEIERVAAERSAATAEVGPRIIRAEPVVAPEAPPSLVPIPKPQVVPAAPVFVAYPSAPEDTKEFLEKLRSATAASAKPPRGRSAALFNSMPPEVSTAVEAFTKAAGLAGMPAMQFVLQSVVVTLLGGAEESRIGASGIALPGKPVAKPEARYALSGLSGEAVDWILRKLVIGDDPSEAMSYPSDVVEEVTSFKDALVGKVKPEDLGRGIKTALRMYLTVHYDVDTWKSRWNVRPNYWTLNQSVGDAIGATVAARKTISPSMRAFLISTAVSMI